MSKMDVMQFAIIVARNLKPRQRVIHIPNGPTRIVREPDSAYTVAALCDKLMRLARKVNRLATAMCNVPEPPKGWGPMQARLRAAVEKVITHEMGKGCKAIISWDPRGAAISLVWRNGPSNTWAGDGYAVPEGR